MDQQRLAIFLPDNNDIHTIARVLEIDNETQPIYVYDALDDGMVVCSNLPLNEDMVYEYLEKN